MADGVPEPTEPAQRSHRAVMTVIWVLAVATIAVALQVHDGPAPEFDRDPVVPLRHIPEDLAPHPQADLPPLPFPAYPMDAPAETVTAAYRFAAEHPEVLSYVPCFCGCERLGHSGNEDCFVKARNSTGDVVEWDEHGMECSICLDVATRARALYLSGTSVEEIQGIIKAERRAHALSHTPTPDAPHGH